MPMLAIFPMCSTALHLHAIVNTKYLNQHLIIATNLNTTKCRLEESSFFRYIFVMNTELHAVASLSFPIN